MAKINDNLLVRGARGNVGKQFVYKRRGDNTHIARMPKVKKDAIPTAAQEEHRELFAAASLYATGAISNPALKLEYQEKAGPGETAFNVALRDYLKSPQVKKIDASKYDGTIGSILSINARDDFRVADVKVSIHDATGFLVEEGNAVLSPLDRNKWIYTATQENTVFAGTRITVIASDLPGNTAMLQVTL